MALREHPREVHTAATRSTPVWRTDNMNTHMYGHGDGHEKGMFSFDEFLAITTSGNCNSGHGDLKDEGRTSGSRDADKVQVVRFEQDHGVVGVGGPEEMLGHGAGIGGRQSNGPGGANGRFGGLGEESKCQDGGEG